MNRLLSGGLVAAYLGAIVAANLISAHFGPSASIYNAFFLIGLSLTTRDRLHDLWGSRRLPYMAALILGGSVISYAASVLLAPGVIPSEVVARIALASAVAFLVAESFDALTYQLLRRRPWLERSNVSNIVGAVLDSAVFVSIAFGWSWPIVFGQVCAKIAGGFLWSLLIGRLRARREPSPLAVEEGRA